MCYDRPQCGLRRARGGRVDSGLAKALGDGPYGPAPTQSRQRGRRTQYLHTVYGRGYRFVAPVAVHEPLPADEAPHAIPLHGAAGTTRQAAVLSPPLAPARAAL